MYLSFASSKILPFAFYSSWCSNIEFTFLGIYQSVFKSKIARLYWQSYLQNHRIVQLHSKPVIKFYILTSCVKKKCYLSKYTHIRITKFYKYKYKTMSLICVYLNTKEKILCLFATVFFSYILALSTSLFIFLRAFPIYCYKVFRIFKSYKVIK